MTAPHAPSPRKASPEEAVRAWVDNLVVGLEWCPFARREVMQGTVRYVETRATTDLGLLSALAEEFRLMDEHADIETTLVILPHMLAGFRPYLDFMGYVDPLLDSLGRTGIYQVASFHPDYRFEGTEADDPANFTNRSPWPLLHILREDSLSEAIDGWEKKHGPTSGIPERNIARTREMGSDALRLLLERCMNAS